MTKKMKSNDWDELRKIIDDGMEKCDREIFIGFYESATLVTVKPMANEGKEKLPEATKNEPEKPKNEIIVRVPYSKDAKMEAVCCKEELERKGIKIEQMMVSGVCSAVETEHHRIMFWPICNVELDPFFLRGRNVRALVGFSAEERKEVVDTHPRVLIFDCFADAFDLIFLAEPR